jgi:hypothetical protein
LNSDLNKNLNLNKSYFEYLDFLSKCYGINKEDKPLDFLNTLKFVQNTTSADEARTAN